MGEGNIFSLFTLAGGGGYPVQVWMGGVPDLRSGWWGVPHLRSGGYPGQVWMVVGGTPSQV